MRIAALQTDIAWEDPAANFERLGAPLRRAADGGARLLVLPETFACGFSMDTAKVAEAPDGPTATFLHEQAEALGVWIAGSIPIREAAADRARNTLLLAGPAGEDHRYRKIHPFTHHGEDEHYAPGDAFLVVEVEGLRLAFFVCYDLRFADEFWALAERVDGYVVVANWPEPRREHWRTLLRARAIENQAYVVGVNRVGPSGDDPPVCHAGDSAIVDPWGRVLVEGAHVETTLFAEIERAVVDQARRQFPVLRDRRTGEAGRS